MNPADYNWMAIVLAAVSSFALGAVWYAPVVFALFRGPRPSLRLGVGAGFAPGSCWVATSLGVNYLFEQKSLRLFLINGGYHTAQFTVIGLVLGLWH